MNYTLNNNPRAEDTAVIIERGALQDIGRFSEDHTKVVVVSDESTAKHCLPQIKTALKSDFEHITLPDGEANKNLKYVEDTLRQLREYGLDRNSLIIGLGGGVVNDVAGFVASTYMRGIAWVMLPTTLTAQADASIGGKTGVNLGGYKNMVGSFWPPKAVLIDPDFLQTLPVRHLKNGLAEIIKMGYIKDKDILQQVKKIDADNLLGDDLDKASELAAKAKIDIVNSDMREAGERKLLNFGHTVGHALEAISLESDSPLLHGEAISIGMVAEARLAELEKVCDAGLADDIKSTLERFGLPTSYGHAVYGEVMERIASDKKNIGSNIYWTLPKEPGAGVYNHTANAENIEKIIRSVL